MSMAGPQLGGISLMVHLIVNFIFFLKSLCHKAIVVITRHYQKIFHPYPPGAK
jgi:thiosulfate reductase cytochrome b subunit